MRKRNRSTSLLTGKRIDVMALLVETYDSELKRSSTRPNRLRKNLKRDA